MTASSTPRLSERARKFVYPPTIVKTVWPRVEAKGLEIGLGFDWWQSQAGSVCLGYGSDGKYVATVGGIGMSIPRQVGKTYFVLAVVVIMCILFPGLQVVWTAHHLRTSSKTFRTLRGICRRKGVAPHIRALRSANGEQQVEFINGSMWMFGARAMGFGRGFDEIDFEVFDEAQILDTKSLEDMIAGTNQARHEHGALLFFMGTPPRPADPSEAFTLRRAEAWAGEAEDAIWLEFGADPHSDPNDRSQWPIMNPSYPTRTPHESMLRLRKNLKNDDSWNREGRGVWDELTRADGPPITVEDWLSCQTDDAAILPDAPVTLCAEIALDRKSASISSVGAGADGKPCLTLLMHDYGTSWVADALIGLAKSNRLLKLHRGDAKKRRKLPAVVIDPTSPAGTLVDPLRAAGVEPVLMTTREVATAAAALQDALWHDGLVHGPSELVEKAVEKAVRRDLGDGLWAFGRKKSAAADVPVDITPLVALSNAHWAFTEAIQPYDLMSSFW